MSAISITDMPDRVGANPPVPAVPAELIPPFDYTQFDAGFAEELRRTADRVRKRNNGYVAETGHDLLDVKDRLKHGEFTAWVEDECGLKIRTAQRIMLAAGVIAKNDKLSYLPVEGLAALASPRAPKAIVEGIIERIEAGARPSAAQITREITAAKPKAENTATSASPGPELASDPAPRGAGGSSVEQQYATLNDAWERACPEARQLFLAHRRAELRALLEAELQEPFRMNSAVVTVQPPPASSEASDREPPRNDERPALLPIGEAVDPEAASTIPAALPAEVSDDDEASEVPAGGPDGEEQPSASRASDAGSTQPGEGELPMPGQIEETEGATSAALPSGMPQQTAPTEAVTQRTPADALEGLQ